MTKNNILCDLDGTVNFPDISNEDSHLYPTAKPFPRSVEILNSLYDAGHTITFFTAREEKDRQVTVDWLNKYGFKYHGLIMNKPRGGRYIWIDNLDVVGVKYTNSWDSIPHLLWHAEKSMSK